MGKNDANLLIKLLERLLASETAKSDTIIFRTAKGLLKKLKSV